MNSINKKTENDSQCLCEWITFLLESVDIEKIVGEYTELSEINGRIWGLCPFHEENIPSFMVSAENGTFKCFGCGKAGNAINFVMEAEHMSFGEACIFLAEKAGIEVPGFDFESYEVEKANE